MKLQRLIFTLGIVGILAGCATVKDVLPGFYEKPSEPSKPVSSEKLKDEYQVGARAALEPYWTTANGVQARAKLLDLKVPSEYLDVHLKLVIAFDQLEQGKAAADQAKIEEAMDTINELAGQYSWLKQ